MEFMFFLLAFPYCLHNIRTAHNKRRLSFPKQKPCNMHLNKSVQYAEAMSLAIIMQKPASAYEASV